MRYAIIPECAFEASKAQGEYTGQKTIMALLSSAFDEDFNPDDIDASILPVYIALHEGIDNSVYDDDEDFRPCKHKAGIAHVEMIPHMVDHDFFERFIRDLESALDDDEDDEGED